MSGSPFQTLESFFSTIKSSKGIFAAVDILCSIIESGISEGWIREIESSNFRSDLNSLLDNFEVVVATKTSTSSVVTAPNED